jgi:DNA-binding NtrC family response regulator
VNCAAIPDGLLESELFGHESGAFTGAVGRRDGLMQAADSGTMFLDEIADMGVQGQAKILRALETREVYRLGGKRPERLDVRFVAATNQDLERAVEEGRFRKDLYYRLAVVRVHLPALRERRSDIGLLLDHYLEQLNPEPTSAATLAEDTRQMLQAYDWPGNVRELKNLVEALFVAAPTHPIALDDLPDAFRASLRRMAAAGGAERRRLMDALLAANWNKSRAAKMLHWSRMTVYRKMAKYSVILSTDARLRHGR